MLGWNARFAGTSTTPLWGMITGKFPLEQRSPPCLITGVAPNVMGININLCCCMSLLDPRIALLEVHFREVEMTRMRDVPILNPALQVEAVGFQPIHAGCLGVLITPWFMNLVWLPSVERGADMPDSPLLTLPSGEYECQPNYAPTVGAFYTCSLFSPVLQFESQAAAVLTAREVMKLMLGVPPSANVSRRDFLRGKFS